MNKYRRDNKEFRASVAARAVARGKSRTPVLHLVGYWLLANAVKVWAIAGKIVGEPWK